MQRGCRGERWLAPMEAATRDVSAPAASVTLPAFAGAAATAPTAVERATGAAVLSAPLASTAFPAPTVLAAPAASSVCSEEVGSIRVTT